MQSFKYRGTPEQMAKVVKYLESKNVDWLDDDREGDYLVYEVTGSDSFAGLYHGCKTIYDEEGYPEMPPELELAIFGKTERITGKPDKSIPDEEYFKRPETSLTFGEPVNVPEDMPVGDITCRKVDGPMEDFVEIRDGSVPRRNKYAREIKPGVWVDVYDVLRAFVVTDSALAHLVKKALAVGQRGHKDAGEDYQDIYDSSKRALEMYKEWNV